MASINELTPLYVRAKNNFDDEHQLGNRGPGNDENGPRTPAELPINVPLRVTEFKMLLIRNLVFDTARGLRAPSRTPHAPPIAKPSKKKGEHVMKENNKETKDGSSEILR
jgi:hypothetical protein